MSIAKQILTPLAVTFSLAGCESAQAQYVHSEFAGTTKPEGGIHEIVSASKAYKANAAALRRAALAVLDEQGYIYKENPSTGTIKTEPKPVSDPETFIVVGATYAAKVFIRLDGSTVTYRARFDKNSNLTQDEQNVEYPEKENELRKAFFVELDKKLGG